MSVMEGSIFNVTLGNGTGRVPTTVFWPVMEPVQSYVEVVDSALADISTHKVVEETEQPLARTGSKMILREEYVFLGATVVLLILVLAVVASRSSTTLVLPKEEGETAEALLERVSIMPKTPTKKAVSRVAQGVAVAGGVYALETVAQGLVRPSSPGIIGNSTLLLGIAIVGFLMASVTLTKN